MIAPKLHTHMYEAGLDEAGRGCYAGPVFAAAVVLPEGFDLPGLDDSKKLTEKNRNRLRLLIEEQAIDFAVARVEAEEIDKINILRASIKAMHLAVSKLKKVPEFLLVDGNQFTAYPGIPHKCVVKGDSLFANIAAASILAKTYRDEYMQELHQQFPVYAWNKNKGYGTADHRLAIEKYGLCYLHRKSFQIQPRNLNLWE